MIRLPDQSLPVGAQRTLTRWQHEIDALPHYVHRVAQANTKFTRRNRSGNQTFMVIRETLSQMCFGAQRCGYCEDSAGIEIDHIQPKHLYPEKAFVWENYLYTCGGCNRPKSNQYAIFAKSSGELKRLETNASHSHVPPEAGAPVFIDPRKEDPLEHLILDLQDTFYFQPFSSPGSLSYQRAEYTIDVLKLNRDLLIVARREAYGSYRARLKEYIRHKEKDAPEASLQELIRALQRMGHPTVWREMQRQHTLLSELKELFTEAPEALTW